MNFYALIIGTEILNARREDKHFKFVQNELKKYGHELFASFIIKDDKELIKRSFKMIKDDKDSILFSFGGIGSTPDDLTREIASEVFTSSSTLPHQQFVKDIIDRFGDDAYPHRIHMADLPPNSQLLFNPINNMSGFSLENRFFFVPGFPQMAHPMISAVIKDNFILSTKIFRQTLLAYTSENSLITLMQKLPNNIELSSLPILNNGDPQVELSLSSKDENSLNNYFNLFIQELKTTNTSYLLT